MMSEAHHPGNGSQLCNRSFADVLRAPPRQNVTHREPSITGHQCQFTPSSKEPATLLELCLNRVAQSYADIDGSLNSVPTTIVELAWPELMRQHLDVASDHALIEKWMNKPRPLGLCAGHVVGKRLTSWMLYNFRLCDLESNVFLSGPCKPTSSFIGTDSRSESSTPNHLLGWNDPGRADNILRKAAWPSQRWIAVNKLTMRSLARYQVLVFHLILCKSDVDDRTLADLVYMSPYLISLNVSKTNVTDEGLHTLRCFSGLKNLDISKNSAITGWGFKKWRTETSTRSAFIAKGSAGAIEQDDKRTEKQEQLMEPTDTQPSELQVTGLQFHIVRRRRKGKPFMRRDAVRKPRLESLNIARTNVRPRYIPAETLCELQTLQLDARVASKERMEHFSDNAPNLREVVIDGFDRQLLHPEAIKDLSKFGQLISLALKRCIIPRLPNGEPLPTRLAYWELPRKLGKWELHHWQCATELDSLAAIAKLEKLHIDIYWHEYTKTYPVDGEETSSWRYHMHHKKVFRFQSFASLNKLAMRNTELESRLSILERAVETAQIVMSARELIRTQANRSSRTVRKVGGRLNELDCQSPRQKLALAEAKKNLEECRLALERFRPELLEGRRKACSLRHLILRGAKPDRYGICDVTKGLDIIGPMLDSMTIQQALPTRYLWLAWPISVKRLIKWFPNLQLLSVCRLARWEAEVEGHLEELLEVVATLPSLRFIHLGFKDLDVSRFYRQQLRAIGSPVELLDVCDLCSPSHPCHSATNILSQLAHLSRLAPCHKGNCAEYEESNSQSPEQDEEANSSRGGGKKHRDDEEDTEWENAVIGSGYRGREQHWSHTRQKAHSRGTEDTRVRAVSRAKQLRDGRQKKSKMKQRVQPPADWSILEQDLQMPDE